MTPQRQMELMKAVHEFQLDKKPLEGDIASQKINNFFGNAGAFILNIMKIIVPIITLVLLKQTTLLIILGVGYGLLAGAFVMTFFNKRSLDKKLKVEFEKFQIYLKNKGFTEQELRDTILSSGGLALE